MSPMPKRTTAQSGGPYSAKNLASRALPSRFFHRIRFPGTGTGSITSGCINSLHLRRLWPTHHHLLSSAAPNPLEIGAVDVTLRIDIEAFILVVDSNNERRFRMLCGVHYSRSIPMLRLASLHLTRKLSKVFAAETAVPS